MTGVSSSNGNSRGLESKRVMVTAAASGIGLAIARTFQAAGARVHICDVDEEALAAAAREMPDVGTTRADVTRPEEVEVFFREAQEHLDGLDVLVNNAGIAGSTGAVEDVSPGEWRRTLAVNLDSQFYCARLAVPLLKRQRGGAIVNLSSTAGLFGCPLRSPYAASKWGVIGFTKTLAMELGPYGIRVNAICPGSVDGERIERVIAAEASSRGVEVGMVRDSYLRQVSMRTFVSPEDVAELVLFISSEAGAKISGQALSVDGHTEGLSMTD